MSFQPPITIKEAVLKIQNREYFLPAIQREFVWNAREIEVLFDSLMRGYPIGTFLFWFVEKEKSRQFQFYEFMRTYHERDNRHNPKSDIAEGREITAVLDGQQRLTALLLGLKGTFAYKLKNKRRDSIDAYPERNLYLNILENLDKNDADGCEYNFRFLTKDEAKFRSTQTFWFKVGDILNFEKEVEMYNYVVKEGIGKNDQDRQVFANNMLSKLHEIICKKHAIHYFLEKDGDLEKTLNIFIRVNSRGRPLNSSDLMLSIATTQWESLDAREVILKFVDEINTIGRGFDIDKDFVLRTCLVLSDSSIAFKVGSLNKNNMAKVEKYWDAISNAIRCAVTFASDCGFDRDTLPSNIALIPIAYYIYRNCLKYDFISSSKFKNDRELAHKWLLITLLKRTFSGQPENVLKPIRDVLIEHTGTFPFEALANKLKGTPKSIIFDIDDIEALFDNQYQGSHTFATMALLYPSLDFKNKFHMDHIFPKNLFTMKNLVKNRFDRYKCEVYLENFNYIANLQLMDETTNLEKSDMDFKEWLFKQFPKSVERKIYMDKHYIPDTDLSFDNFDEFFKQRKQLMKNKFLSILKMDK